LNVADIEFALDNAGAQKFSRVKPGQAIPLKNPPLVLYAKSTQDTIDLLVVAGKS
jgi:hypothetical protein